MSDGEAVDLAKEIRLLHLENERLTSQAAKDRRSLHEQLLQSYDDVLVAQRENSLLMQNISDLTQNNSDLESSLLTVANEKIALQEEVLCLQDELSLTEKKYKSLRIDHSELREKASDCGLLFHIVACPSALQSPHKGNSGVFEESSSHTELTESP